MRPPALALWSLPRYSLALAIGAVALTGCVSGEQRGAADRVEDQLRELDGVVAAGVRTWATSASSDNASFVLRVDADTTEAELADLLAGLGPLVDEAGLAGLHAAYVLVGGTGEVELDRDGAPTDETTPRVIVSAVPFGEPDAGALEVDAAEIAGRFAHSSDRFGSTGSVTVRGSGAVEVAFNESTESADDPVGDALDVIVGDGEMSTWADGWELRLEAASGEVTAVATADGLDEDVAGAWHAARDAVDDLAGDATMQRLVFERPFSTWNVYSTIRLDPVVPPAALTPGAWGDELAPFIEAQLAATADLDGRQFSLTNLYGATPDEFKVDTFLATDPAGNFTDRGWNAQFLG